MVSLHANLLAPAELRCPENRTELANLVGRRAAVVRDDEQGRLLRYRLAVLNTLWKRLAPKETDCGAFLAETDLVELSPAVSRNEIQFSWNRQGLHRLNHYLPCCRAKDPYVVP